jgi:glutamate 5-kinase
MVLTLGTEAGPLSRLAQGARATWFLSGSNPRQARKRWIASGLKSEGVLTVDDGALKALGQGRSLLPIGVTAVDGDFARGAAVSVRDKTGREVARGLIEYPASDARAILGHKSSEIERVLGYRGADEMIHRDDMVVTEQGT